MCEPDIPNPVTTESQRKQQQNTSLSKQLNTYRILRLVVLAQFSAVTGAVIVVQRHRRYRHARDVQRGRLTSSAVAVGEYVRLRVCVDQDTIRIEVLVEFTTTSRRFVSGACEEDCFCQVLVTTAMGAARNFSREGPTENFTTNVV